MQVYTKIVPYVRASNTRNHVILKEKIQSTLPVSRESSPDGSCERRKKNDEIIRCLEAGAEINWAFEKFGTVLQVAARIGNPRIVALLLTKGANVNACSGPYGYALQASAAGGYERVVKLLLD